MAKKQIKVKDQTVIVNEYGDLRHEIANRVMGDEARLAVSLIEKWAMVASNTGTGLQGQLLKPGEVVERAFDIAHLTMKHIKDNKMDAPFPFKKVFGE